MKNIIFLLALIISTNISAVPLIKNPELSNAVASVESAFANKQYELAEKKCREIFDLKNTNAQKELEKLKSSDNIPYTLRLHLILLDCMACTRQSYSDSFKKECEQTLAKYKDLPEAKEFIQWVYLHLSEHYRAIYNKKMGVQILKEGADALPKSHLPVYYVINLMDSSPKPLPANIISEVKRIIKKNKEINNNKLTAGMAYCKLILIKKTEGNVFHKAIDFLKSYPNADFEYIKGAIEIAREAIPFDKPEQVKDYHNMLMILAIKQPNTKGRLKVIGFIINEKKKLNKTLLIISIISIFQSLNIHATTNKVALDYQKKIDELKNTYASQWDVLTKNADELALSINKAQKAQNLLDELIKRIENKNDPLDNLQKYEPVIYDSTTAHLIYDNAYDMLKAGDSKRSGKLFDFLINDKNPNGFAVGSSYYWRAVLLEELYHNTDGAFNAYLQVHAYPACLVYTDDSYIRAARICRFRKHRDTALALYSIRVPQIDYYKNEFRKIFASIDIARERNDLTNRVRQVMRANELSQCKPKYEKLADSVYKDLCGRTSTNKIAAISADLAKTESFDQYTMKTIIKALTGPDAATNNPALEDMLLHDWPLMDNVAELHPEILTNRTLSNNIFKQKRRKDILKQYEF